MAEQVDVNKLKEELGQWRNRTLNIAFIGQSGSGKSSLINRFMNLKDADEGAAESNYVEGTQEPKSYTYPGNEYIKLWDLPGVGTPNFPRSTYLQKIEYNRHDFFLIISQSRFTEDDIIIAKEIKKMNKKFVFVKSFADNDIKKGGERGQTEDQVMNTLRTAFERSLRDIGENCAVFLVDCTKKELEFNDLERYIKNNLDALKREVWILSARFPTKEMIMEKKEALKGRIWKVAAISAAAGAVPIPGLSFGVDLSLLLHEIKLYMNQFGLDEISLERTARIFNTNVNDLRGRVKKMALVITTIDNANIRNLITFLLHAEGIALAVFLDKATDQLSYLIPLIGSVLAATVSYKTTYFILEKLLDWSVEDAMNVLDAAITDSAE